MHEIWKAGVKQQPFFFFHFDGQRGTVAAHSYLALICYLARAAPATSAASASP